MQDKFIFTAFLLLIFSLEPAAQELVTDRPDITESALTVPLYSLQVETGFVYQENLGTIGGSDLNERTISFAGTLLRYGILSFLELRGGTEFISRQIKSAGMNETIEGINGLLIGTKLQLIRDDTELPDAAVFFHLNLPAGNKNLRSETAEPEILLAASQSITDPLSISGNIGGTWESSDKLINYFFSTSLGIELSGKTGIFVELFGDLSAETSPSYNFDAGLVYLLFENLQLDISSGFNFDKPGENWFAGSGISFRVPE